MLRYSLLTAGLMLGFSAFAAPAGDLPLMPWPAKVERPTTQGALVLNNNVSISVSGDDLGDAVNRLRQRIALQTGWTLQPQADKPEKPTIRIAIAKKVKPLPLPESDESYRLTVDANGVDISANTRFGALRAMETLLQLMQNGAENTSLPWVTIEDSPRFPWRGLLLDSARHFIPLPDIKRQIDGMAAAKLNVLHWHLTDDQGWRFSSKRYPKLTQLASDGLFYTPEQMREVVRYATERGIRVVPEIDMPGHCLSAIANYEGLSCFDQVGWGKVFTSPLCPGKDAALEFCRNVWSEVIALFPYEYVHIGGDEVEKDNWRKCADCQRRIAQQGLKGVEELQSWFIHEMERFFNAKGRRMIGWDEILEGGLAPSATVMSWRGEEGGIAAASMNHDVIMTPGSEGMYIDQFQGDYKINPVSIGGFTTAERVYKYNPVPDTLAAAGKGHFIKGVQCNVWSEYLYNTDIMEYRIYPRILALSEIAWSPLDRKDYKDFERRLDNAQVRLDGHGINYYIPQPEQPNGSCNFVAFTDKATMTFTTNRPMKMVYTLDGTEPTPESTVYTAPFDITETTTVKIASVLPSGKMGKPRTILVEKQTLAPAKEVAKTTPGLDMEVFDGMYLSVNNLEAAQKTGKKQVIKTTRELTNQVPAPESMRGVKQYAAIATGYVNIPEDGVYYISSDLEEVWIDGKLMVNNGGEVKRFSRHDTSAALAKGLHEIKLVFLGHIIGGWPSNWNDGSVQLRKSDAEKFTPITAEMLSH